MDDRHVARRAQVVDAVFEREVFALVEDDDCVLGQRLVS
jgi:hypothetical protein